MAKVIEFYIPKNFRKRLSTAAQPRLGKIIEFCPRQKDEPNWYPFFGDREEYEVHSHAKPVF